HDRVSESLDRYDAFDLSDNLIFAIDGGIRNILRNCNNEMQMGSLLCTKEKAHIMKPSLFSFKRSLDVSSPPQQPLIDISNIELDFKKKYRAIFSKIQPLH
ncbi:hypothetical protein HID58_044425, partial [Brassica napus]